MSAASLDFVQLGYALAAVLYGALAVLLLGRRATASESRRASRLFMGGLLATGAWAAFECAYALLDARWLAYTAYALDWARYALWFSFILLLLKPEPGENTAPDRGRFLGVLAVLLVALAAAIRLQVGFSSPVSASGLRLLLLSSLSLSVLGLFLVEQLFRNQPIGGKWNARLVCLGLAVGFAFDLFIYAEAVMFGGFDRGALDARGMVHAMAVPLLIVASRRHRAWIEKMRVSRTAAVYTVSLLLVGGYLLFIASAGYYVRYFGGSWGRALQVTLLFAALLLLVLLLTSGTVRARLLVFLGKHFFRYRYDYRNEWLKFTNRLSQHNSSEQVGVLVVQGLADLVESPGGSLWTRGLHSDRFVQTARWNSPSGSEHVLVDSPFLAFMSEKDWIIDVVEFRNYPKRYGDLALPPWLSTSGDVWLIVPLVVVDDLVGFVALMPPRTALDLNWEVRDLLKTVSRQAASFLAHVQATEALLESRKLDAFNRMSAFVVHDLKNIVTQLSLMMKNEERHRNNPEFQKDMMLTIRHSLDKMQQLILQLREGNAGPGTLPGVDLQAVITQVERLALPQQRKLSIDAQTAVWTRGDPQRLERVVGHVVQNALDATVPAGHVKIRLAREVGQAVIEVSDDGVGMTQEFIQTRLYRPFNTTKQSGMGIGAYESFQYLKELGGGIDVKSEVGKGTVVTLKMPLLELDASAGQARRH